MTPNNQSVSGDAQNFGRPRQPMVRSEERRVGKESRSRRRANHEKKRRGTVGLWDELLHRIWGLGTSFAYGSLGRALNRRHLEPQRGTARTARAAYATCTHADGPTKPPVISQSGRGRAGVQTCRELSVECECERARA